VVGARCVSAVAEKAPAEEEEEAAGGEKFEYQAEVCGGAAVLITVWSNSGSGYISGAKFTDVCCYYSVWGSVTRHEIEEPL
jgi:hypothetical protein